MPKRRFPIAVLHNAAPRPGDQAQSGDPLITAILHEIVDKLDTLSSCAEASTIDLRWLASSVPQMEKLRGLLGTGEVRAEVNAGGRSEIRETAIPCVWWVRHFDSSDQIRGEFIEVAEAPDLLRADRQSIPAGLTLLRGLCMAATSDRDACGGRERT